MELNCNIKIMMTFQTLLHSFRNLRISYLLRHRIKELNSHCAHLNLPWAPFSDHKHSRRILSSWMVIHRSSPNPKPLVPRLQLVWVTHPWMLHSTSPRFQCGPRIWALQSMNLKHQSLATFATPKIQDSVKDLRD